MTGAGSKASTIQHWVSALVVQQALAAESKPPPSEKWRGRWGDETGWREGIMGAIRPGGAGMVATARS